MSNISDDNTNSSTQTDDKIKSLILFLHFLWQPALVTILSFMTYESIFPGVVAANKNLLIANMSLWALFGIATLLISIIHIKLLLGRFNKKKTSNTTYVSSKELFFISIGYLLLSFSSVMKLYELNTCNCYLNYCLSSLLVAGFLTLFISKIIHFLINKQLNKETAIFIATTLILGVTSFCKFILPSLIGKNMPLIAVLILQGIAFVSVSANFIALIKTKDEVINYLWWDGQYLYESNANDPQLKRCP